MRCRPSCAENIAASLIGRRVGILSGGALKHGRDEPVNRNRVVGNVTLSPTSLERWAAALCDRDIKLVMQGDAAGALNWFRAKLAPL